MLLHQEVFALNDLIIGALKKGPRVNIYALLVAAVIAIIISLIPWYSNHLLIESEESDNGGEYVKSLHAAERAVKINPISVQARFVLAGAQQRLGREVEARKTLIRATEIQPLNYATWELLALYERDRWHQEELARQHFDTAIKLNPNDDRLRENAGLE